MHSFDLRNGVLIGNLLRAYQLVGYSPARDYAYVEINLMLQRMHPKIIADTVVRLRTWAGQFGENPDRSPNRER